MQNNTSTQQPGAAGLSKEQLQEIQSAFTVMPTAEILSFLAAMLHRRILIHRKVQSLLLVAEEGSGGQGGNIYLPISADDKTSTIRFLRRAIQALSEKLRKLEETP